MMERLEKAKELLNIQAQPGNWNYDPYMQGMYNGMELIIAMIEDREPVYKEKPEEWLFDKTADFAEPVSQAE